MAKGICSVCSAPGNVLQAVNDALARKEKLRDLEKRSGFSRSALSRHGRRCIAVQTLTTYRDNKFHPETDRAIVRWPNQTIPALGPNDWLVAVSFEDMPSYASKSKIAPP